MSRCAAAAGFAALLSTAAPCVAAPSAWTLTRVNFVGNSQVPTAELEAALPIKPGETIDRAGLESDTDAVGSVYQKHNVGVNISQRLIFIVSWSTVIYTLAEQTSAAPVTHAGIIADSVAVTGNKHVSTAAILAAAGISPGSPVDNAKIQAAQNAITALYKKRNVGATVATDWTTPAPQHVAMVFKITETAP